MEDTKHPIAVALRLVTDDTLHEFITCALLEQRKRFALLTEKSVQQAKFELPSIFGTVTKVSDR